MTDYKEFIEHFMNKSAESVDSAREQLRDGHAEFAASRAYYAMFYAAEAALLSKNLQFKKHSAVISAFNREFVKPGDFPPETAKKLKKAFDFRMQGDYSIIPIKQVQAEAVIDDAAAFIEMIQSYLLKEGFSQSP